VSYTGCPGVFAKRQQQLTIKVELVDCVINNIPTTLDLIRTFERLDVHATFPTNHPQKSLNAMRLLAATEPEGQTRIKLTHQLYKTYWLDNKDVTDSQVLQSAVSKVGWDVDVNDVLSNENAKEELRRNTDEAIAHGAFGVPSFWVNNHLYWGVDRIHFVEEELIGSKVLMQRIALPPSPGKPPFHAKLTIYHDFSSPWSYLGSQQVLRGV
jgi:2-hydroxychromene-2-carboxylate isomerase